MLLLIFTYVSKSLKVRKKIDLKMLAQFYQFNGLLEVDLLYLVAFILTFALLGLDFKNNFKHL